jgi:predicted MFS family arabinose efflux permease
MAEAPSVNSDTKIRRQLRLAGIAAFAAMASMRVCDAMLQTLAAEFGRSVGEVSHVISFFAVSYGLMQLVYGPIGDRVGKLRVVALACAACAGASVFVAVTPTFDALVAGRALMGAAAAGIVPLTMAWIGDNVAYDQRQETLARLLGATVSGMMAGQWLGAWITDALGWRYAFWMLATLFFAAAVPLGVQLFVRRSVVRDTGHRTFTNPLSLLRESRVRWVLGVTAIEGALVFGTLAFVPSYLVRQFDLSVTAAGGVIAVYGLGGLVYSRCARRWLFVLGERGMAFAGGSVLCLGLLLLSWSGSWVGTLPACLFAGTGFYMLHATLQMQATQMSPTRRGAAMSLFSCSLFLGQSFGVVLMASAVDKGWTLWAFSAMAAALAVLGVGVGRRLGPPVNSEAVAS